MLVWSLLYRTSISVSRTPAVPFLFTIQHKVRFSPQSNHANYDAYKCRLFVSTLRLTSILTKEKRLWWQGDRWWTERPETSYLGGWSRKKGMYNMIHLLFQQTSLNVVVTFWNYFQFLLQEERDANKVAHAQPSILEVRHVMLTVKRMILCKSI